MDTTSIKPGAHFTGRTKGGLNLNNFVKKLLRSIGFAVTTDCCVYFPSFPILPNDDIYIEDVPIGGIFRFEGNSDRVYFKAEDGAVYYIEANPY